MSIEIQMSGRFPNDFYREGQILTQKSKTIPLLKKRTKKNLKKKSQLNLIFSVTENRRVRVY